MSQKKVKTRNIRNVLATPFSIQWSESSLEEVEFLQKSLEELLPLAKLEKKNFKLFPKGKTKDNSLADNPLMKKHKNMYRSFLAPGFQSVIRGLEKQELLCVIISTDITPPMLPRIVCSYCNTYNVPLMTMPQLKTISKATLGFPSMVLGFKKTPDNTENPFIPIYELVSRNRSTFEIPAAKQHENTYLLEKDKCVSINEKSHVSFDKSEEIYLFRENKNIRMFRPGPEPVRGISNVQQSTKHEMNADFISINRSKTDASGYEHANKSIHKTDDKCDIEDYSDSDSLDEDNMFFIDNKPDKMLLDKEQSNSVMNDSQTEANLQSEVTKNPTNKKAITVSQRYFSSKIKQDVKLSKTKTEDKNMSKLKPELSQNKEIKHKGTSFTFNPLTVKTIKSNPKKNKRKKK